MNKADIHKINLDTLFNPKSIAIVGANNQKGTVPYDIVNNIVKSKFTGTIYPVSPREKYIDDLKTHKYVIDIEDPIDLAIVVFPSPVCHLALEQMGEKGIKSAIIISAGFKEIGEVGLERELRIKEIADNYGISFIGPNCLGAINTDPNIKLNASFAREMPSAGNIGFLSQSGALCTAVLDYAQSKNIGISKFISFGNKADVSEIDLLYYLADDINTKVILMYLEEINNGRDLMKCASDIISRTGKPILAIKSGRTDAGASAAASHTGSLAGSDKICDAAFRQAGIIRCNDIREMFDKAIAFAYQPIPKNNRVAIVTNAGGPGVLTTDAVINDKNKMAVFSDVTKKKLKRALPRTANINNPVDVIGDARADRY
ncbi:MAG: CoA-binding protein, partial [Melioribacteraceae bacterium]|nr:CoA-binding protein [Melioribacteraceae bacterium]